MHATVPILTLGPYSLAFVVGLLLYWNTSLIVSRVLTAFIVSMIAMKLALFFHLLFSCCYRVVSLLFRFRTFWNPNDALDLFRTQSQFYTIADMASLALMVGNSLQFWTATLVMRVALSTLAARTELSMRWWQSQSAAEHSFSVVVCLLLCTGCALQWAYYTLLPQEERTQGGTGSLLMWYTSIVYIVEAGLRSACMLVTATMRMWGYRVLQSLLRKINPIAVRALEDSGLNPFSEVHDLYMQYLYSVACAATAWYYTLSSTTMWMQCFMLLRIYLIALASGKLRHYRHVLDHFPSVAADPTKACGICLDDFVGGESVKSLPCGHTFHGACVRSWLIRAAVCPTCRQPVAELSYQHFTVAHPERISRQPRVSLDMRVPAIGGSFTGSLQPLAPRLPATAPLARVSSQDVVHSGRDVLSQSPSLPVELRRLPHYEELQRVDAKRRSLALHRQQQQQFFSEGARAAASQEDRHEAETKNRVRDQSAGVDDLLFKEQSLLPVESASLPLHSSTSSGRRKRQRPPLECTSRSVTSNANAVFVEAPETEGLQPRRRMK
ncbi:Ring finger domain/RING-like zinc finger/RING-type zinc-finger/Zinc finger, C3HC4 type (RING finger) containing protein, putative [Leishmania shawi]|uniref:Ring finger domain/RING-like zinc finger/RING-type zinc-finger n=1 Tax=Leishmania shawi TaxID=5680 RepID=A0ABR3DV45_9TRYP